ncbi:MAG: hypothetical protein ACOH5I_13915 [Oligoflexus sp.]
MKEPKDYIIRLMKRMAVVFARMIGLIDDKRYTEAREQINHELEDLTGLPTELLDQADAPFISHMLTLNEQPEKILVVAELYFLKGRVSDELGDPVEGRRFYFICQECLALIDSDNLDTELQKRVNRLHDDVSLQLI